MAEGYANSSYNWPNMNRAAADLSKEWERFYQHCEFTFGGPLSKYPASRGFSLAWLLAFTKSFACLFCRVVGLFTPQDSRMTS